MWRTLLIGGIIVGPAVAAVLRRFSSRGQYEAERWAEIQRLARQYNGAASAAPQTPAPAAHPFGSTSHHARGSLQLRYRDRGGQETSRLVTLHSVLGATTATGAFYPQRFEGYCHLRKGARSFVISRIVEAFDPDTGEVIKDIHAWLRRSIS